MGVWFGGWFGFVNNAELSCFSMVVVFPQVNGLHCSHFLHYYHRLGYLIRAKYGQKVFPNMPIAPTPQHAG